MSLNRSLPNGANSVIRVSLAWVSEAVGAISDLKKIDQNTSTLDCYMAVIKARSNLQEMYQTSVYRPHLRASVSQAGVFEEKLREISDRIKSNFDAEVAYYDRVSISSGANTFLSILLSELGVVPTFLITPKEGYDLNILAESGDLLFPPLIVVKVKGVDADMREAGKALAFDMPTACGFHVFRVLEAVVKGYWDHVSNHTPQPSLKTLGRFSSELEKNSFGDAKVWETLKQITKLHRNPVAHPEVILSAEEAIDILGIVRSAVGQMIRAMPDLPAKTTNPQAGP